MSKKFIKKKKWKLMTKKVLVLLSVGVFTITAFGSHIGTLSMIPLGLALYAASSLFNNK